MLTIGKYVFLIVLVACVVRLLVASVRDPDE